MAAPIYKGGAPFFKPNLRFPNAVLVPLQGAGAPTNGTSGTGAGKAGVGSLYIDTTAGVWYTNTNTKASPTWTVITGATGAISATSLTVTSFVKSSGAAATAGIGYSTGA